MLRVMAPSAPAAAQVALSVHGLLQEMDPVRFRTGVSDVLRPRLLAVEVRLSEVLTVARDVRSDADLEERLVELGNVLRDRLPHPNLPRGDWMA